MTPPYACNVFSTGFSLLGVRMTSFLKGDTQHMVTYEKFNYGAGRHVITEIVADRPIIRLSYNDKQVTVRHRKLDKGSSNKPLCVYGCAAGEKSCYGLDLAKLIPEFKYARINLSGKIQSDYSKFSKVPIKLDKPKLDNNDKKGIFLGFNIQSNSYLIMDYFNFSLDQEKLNFLKLSQQIQNSTLQKENQN
ncbi:hypothetical protein H8356DRAFT_1324640 [Neocallimastix lanati (nom. inval.)]|nr:hypothetical protein H8356DRAFT_1324640 [Neocallimastix sp. JGI-2020a]